MDYRTQAARQQRHFQSVRGEAKQSWLTGDVVSVGFIKNLMVLGKNDDGAFRLRQLTSDRFYNFLPHSGLTREAA